MNGIGREETELDGMGTRLDRHRLHSMDWTGINWTRVHVSGVD